MERSKIEDGEEEVSGYPSLISLSYSCHSICHQQSLLRDIEICSSEGQNDTSTE